MRRQVSPCLYKLAGNTEWPENGNATHIHANRYFLSNALGLIATCLLLAIVEVAELFPDSCELTNGYCTHHGPLKTCHSLSKHRLTLSPQENRRLKWVNYLPLSWCAFVWEFHGAHRCSISMCNKFTVGLRLLYCITCMYCAFCALYILCVGVACVGVYHVSLLLVMVLVLWFFFPVVNFPIDRVTPNLTH